MTSSLTNVNLLQAITGDSVVLKFEKARSALQDSLRRVEDIVPQTIGSQVIQTTPFEDDIVYDYCGLLIMNNT